MFSCKSINDPLSLIHATASLDPSSRLTEGMTTDCRCCCCISATCLTTATNALISCRICCNWSPPEEDAATEGEVEDELTDGSAEPNRGATETVVGAAVAAPGEGVGEVG